jgi:hypothetical protein
MSCEKRRQYLLFPLSAAMSDAEVLRLGAKKLTDEQMTRKRNWKSS